MNACAPCSDISPRHPRRFRLAAAAIAAVTTLLTIAVAVLLLSELLHAPKPPHVDRQTFVAPALTERLMLFIVDGLRYDLGTDPNVAPNYARHMRTDTHGRMWADRVTMTSSAVLSIGAGQRGDFMQLILNLNGRDLGYDNIVANARTAGLYTALAGDETWIRSFGKFDKRVVDAHGMSIETDNSKEIFAAATSMVHGDPKPNLLIVHLIAPDHQGHAYGVASDKYNAFMRRFDADMEQLFSELSEDWTVIAMSDHGQTATGAHGTDTLAMRLCPFFAYGKGIRPGIDLGDLDQIDVGATMSMLLGIPVPSQGKGTPITAMLNVDDEAAAKISCADASRIERVAQAYNHASALEGIVKLASACRENGTPAARVQAGRAAVRYYDEYVQANRSASGLFGSAVTAFMLFLMVAIPAFLYAWSAEPGVPRRAVVQFCVLAFIVALVCVALTYQVERFAPPWHNVVRAVLFAVTNGVMLYAAMRPTQAAAFYDRRPALVLALLPGAFVWSYPANTSAESIVVLLLGTAVWLFAPHPDIRSTERLFRDRPILPWWRVVLVAASLFGLFFYAAFESDSLPSAITARPWLLVAVGLAAVAAWLTAGANERDLNRGPWELPVAVAAACAMAVGRRYMNADVGLVCLIAFPCLASVALLLRRFTLAWGLGFAGYALVSRDTEVVAVGCGLVLLEAVGQSAASSPAANQAHGGFRPFAVATLVVIVFAVLFLVRVGLLGGLDLANVDYAAGGFGDPEVSQLRLALAGVWKYAAAYLLLNATFYRCLPRDLLLPVAVGVAVVTSSRLAVLSLILYACRSSYWTAFRSVSDAAPTLIAAPLGAMLLAIVGWYATRSPGKTEASNAA